MIKTSFAERHIIIEYRISCGHCAQNAIDALAYPR